MIEKAEMMQKKIAVLYGGLSAEREISLKTGDAVYRALNSLGYEVEAIDVGQDLPRQLKETGAEVAFVALHGRFGEDGRVQGLLEMLQIPYTGSGVLASGMAIDKAVTKQMLLYHELPTPGFEVLKTRQQGERLISECRYLPLVVKPSREGSTIGISIVHSVEELRHGIDAASALDGTVLVEDYIEGKELTVSVVNGDALPIIQIVPKSGFYDYQAKYTAGQTEYICPAPVEAGVYTRIQQVAVKACEVLGCRGAARVDFMLREKEFYCLEVNTIPGMTETSLLPKAANEAGLDFAQLAEAILLDADLDK